MLSNYAEYSRMLTELIKVHASLPHLSVTLFKRLCLSIQMSMVQNTYQYIDLCYYFLFLKITVYFAFINDIISCNIISAHP